MTTPPVAPCYRGVDRTRAGWVPKESDMIVYLSLLVALIGAVVYYVATRAETKELGRLSFACGLLAFLIKLSPAMVSVLTGGG